MNKHTTHVTECEDLLFTMLGFLGNKHLNLRQRTSKSFLHVIRQHFP
jgi:hypothetical protein